MMPITANEVFLELPTMSQHVFRFAPSPNGYLHLGHAYSAIMNHDMAKARGARFLLRIEDIDTKRCKPEFEQAIYEDLGWLGLKWEEPVRRQSDHLAVYADALKRLKELGVVYPAFLSRKDIHERIMKNVAGWPHDPDGAPHYPGDERTFPAKKLATLMKSGAEYAWRLDVAKAMQLVSGSLNWCEAGSGNGETIIANPSAWGDVIIARKDTPTSYHLSVVVDDAVQNVTNVMRGADLYHATSVHRLLQVLLGLSAPSYHHHQLVTDLAGVKLSKSIQSTSLRQLRQDRLTASDVRKMLALESAEDRF
jgi:glutamyl-Q tRNA(Asp) synthetase